MSRIWLKAAWGARRNTPLARYIRIVEVDVYKRQVFGGEAQKGAGEPETL